MRWHERRRDRDMLSVRDLPDNLHELRDGAELPCGLEQQCHRLHSVPRSEPWLADRPGVHHHDDRSAGDRGHRHVRSE